MVERHIVEDDLTGAEIRALLEMHLQHMVDNSPKDRTNLLDIDDLEQPDATVWSIWDGDSLAGCGALREIDPTHGEIKSMRTAPEHLGQGVGRAILNHIVAEARRRGYERVSLETGSSPTFDPALRLYHSSGFEPSEPFAEYVADPFSRFLTLTLVTE